VNASEFTKQVNAYGVHIPQGIAGVGGQTPFYKKRFEFSDTGSGSRRDYSTSNVREVVAWSMWLELTGQRNMDAIHLLSNHDSGWIVTSDDSVEWVEKTPTPETFIGGAVCIPVPNWLDISP